jgi:hypothetical protein
MKKAIGLTFLLALPSMAFAETYLGAGVGSTGGYHWGDEALEVVLGHSYESGFVLEGAIFELGERDTWREESAKGIAIDGGYKVNKGPVEFGAGAGLYLYSADSSAGDSSSSDLSTAPIIYFSGSYPVSEKVDVRLKLRKLFLSDSFGSPTRLSLTVSYKF